MTFLLTLSGSSFVWNILFCSRWKLMWILQRAI